MEVAALLGGADLRRRLQLYVAGGRSRSAGILIPAVHFTREQQPVVRQPGLDHGAEGLVGVDHSSWVGRAVDRVCEQ